MCQADILIYENRSGLEVSIFESSDYRNNRCCRCNKIVQGESLFRRLQFSEILMCSGWKEKVEHAK